MLSWCSRCFSDGGWATDLVPQHFLLGAARCVVPSSHCSTGGGHGWTKALWGPKCTVTLSLLADIYVAWKDGGRATVLLGRVGNKCMESFSQNWCASFSSVKAAEIPRWGPCPWAAWGIHSAQAVGIISLWREASLGCLCSQWGGCWFFFFFFSWFCVCVCGVFFFFSCPGNWTSDIQSQMQGSVLLENFVSVNGVKRSFMLWEVSTSQPRKMHPEFLLWLPLLKGVRWGASSWKNNGIDKTPKGC